MTYRSPVDEFLGYLSKVHKRTQAIVNLLPADKLDWTYRPGKFSAGDLVRHIALTERYLFVQVAQGNPPAYRGCGSEFAAHLDEIKNLYNRLHDESVSLIRSLEPRWAELCTLPGGAQMPVNKWLRAMVEHEIHHRGQLYLYLSMLGIKAPPIFGLTSEQVIEHSAKP